MSNGAADLDLESLLLKSAAPLFAVNARRRLVLFNHAAELLTGVAAATLLGRECRLAGPTQPAEADSLLASLDPPAEAFEGRVTTAPTLVLLPGGERSWRQVSYFPLRSVDGSVALLLGCIGPEADPGSPSTEPEPFRQALGRLRAELARHYGFDQVVAVSPPMRRVLDQVRLASESKAPVLLLGPAGSGKQFLARVVHEQSPSRQGAFTPVDCASLPPRLLAERLATSRASGTLYLREPLRLPRDLQERVLGWLDEPSAPRLAAGSRSPLEPACAAGEFLEALACRLSTLVINLPALRERREELPLLVQQILERCNAAGGRRVEGLRPEAWEVVRAYSWPGNVRELDEVLTQAHDRTPAAEVGPDSLPARLREAAEVDRMPGARPERPLPLDELLTQAERRIVDLAMRAARGNVSKAAQRLGVSRARLHRRLQVLGLVPEVVEEGLPHGEPRDSAPEEG
jgi:transcriptional regulator with PAS, ATPase and Fis domain